MTKFLQLRKSKSLTESQLALELGISQKSISNYETGKNQPTLSVILAYCKFFSVSSDYLLGLNLESTKEVINIASDGKEDISKVISDLEETIKVLRELQKKL